MSMTIHTHKNAVQKLIVWWKDKFKALHVVFCDICRCVGPWWLLLHQPQHWRDCDAGKKVLTHFKLYLKNKGRMDIYLLQLLIFLHDNEYRNIYIFFAVMVSWIQMALDLEVLKFIMLVRSIRTFHLFSLGSKILCIKRGNFVFKNQSYRPLKNDCISIISL